MGTVYKAIDFMAEREVALKMLRPDLARQPQLVARFRLEAKALAKLNHANIATLYSFFRQGDDFFMAMEFVKGETLANRIQRLGAISCDEAISKFQHILEGISYAHQNQIVHRDIKPSNIMLTPEGSAKVMDFGIARVMGTERMTIQGSLIGTLEYMSPEQIQGLEVDARSDIYSLGIVLYEMLTGCLPFTASNEYELMKWQVERLAPSPRSLVPDIPLPVEKAIMRALSKNPDRRFQTVSEFRDTICFKALIQSSTPAAVGHSNRMARAEPFPNRNLSQNLEAQGDLKREPFRRVGFFNLLKDSIKIAVDVARGRGRPISVAEGTGVFIDNVGFHYKEVN